MFKLPENARPYSNCFMVNVTPELAKKWLVGNIHNRQIINSKVSDFIRDIVDGKWSRTHQGIAFSPDGVLVDGQHRLHAIAQSGITVSMLVFVDQPLKSHSFIDGGKKRTMLDILRLEMKDDTIKGKHLSVLKAMIAGRLCVNVNYLTPSELTHRFQRLSNYVKWTCDLFYKTSMTDTTVLSVIARASLHISREKLLEFAAMLCGTVTNDATGKAVADFVTWISRQKDRQESTRREIYKRTQGLLMAFLNGEPTWEKYRENKDYFMLYSQQNS
ncbi:MAG: hypothetical protein ACRC2T_03715 [Thermoguttaceae bacterium]